MSKSGKWFRTSQFGEGGNLFNRFRVSNEYCDVLLASQQEPQLVLRGHRVVLAAVSSVFKRCFDDNKDKVVLIPAITYNSLNYVIKLIYEGEVRVPAKDEFAFCMAMNGLKVRLGPHIDRLLNGEEVEDEVQNDNNDRNEKRAGNEERADKEVAKAVVPPKQRSRAVPMMTGLTTYIKSMPEEEEGVSLSKYVKTDESGGQASVHGQRVKEEPRHKSVVKEQRHEEEHGQHCDEQHHEPRQERGHQRHHEHQEAGQHQSGPSKTSPRDPRLAPSTSSSGTETRRCLPFATGPSRQQFEPMQIRLNNDQHRRSVMPTNQTQGQYQRRADHQMSRDRLRREDRPEQFEWVRFSGCNPNWLPKQYLGLLNKSGCFGFVEHKVAMKHGTGVCGVPFKRASDAEAAVAKFNGKIIHGFTLSVERVGNTFNF